MLALLASVSAVASSSQAEAADAEFAWLARAGGKAADKARGLTADKQGNSYLTGEFSGEADFGEFTLTSRGDKDIFVAKYDPQGRCLWARQAGGTKTDRGYGIAVDDLGEVYVTGHFESDDAVFGEGTPLPNAGGFSVFFAKYGGGDGALRWVRQGGSEGYDTSQGVAVGPDGRAYFTGGLRGPGQIAGAPLPTGSRGNLFLACFSSAGDLEWLRHSAGSGGAQGRSIAIDFHHHLVLGGFGSGGKRIGSLTLPSAAGGESFVVAFDADGEVKWSWHGGGDSQGKATAVALDGSGGVFLAGSFAGTLRFGERTLVSRGGRDFYVARLGAAGEPLWIRHGGGPGDDHALDMVAGPGGDCHVTGELAGTITIDTGSAPLEVASAGALDLYHAVFAADGALRRFVRSGGDRNDLAYCIGVDASGNAYLSGAFDGTARHGAHQVTSRGRNDIFILKITPE